MRFEPRFFQIENLSKDTVELPVRPAVKVPKKEKALLRVKPGKRSRTIDVRSVSQRRRLNTLVSQGKLAMLPVHEIGPSTGRGGAVASYVDEDVYICNECGGPIVFRGSPPRPVHI